MPPSGRYQYLANTPPTTQTSSQSTRLLGPTTCPSASSHALHSTPNPSSAHKGDLRHGLNWRRHLSVFPLPQANTKAAGARNPSPTRKPRRLGFTRAARRIEKPGVSLHLKQEEKIFSDSDGELDKSVIIGGGGDEAPVGRDKQAVARMGGFEHALSGETTTTGKAKPAAHQQNTASTGKEDSMSLFKT